ncbi:hypothetical protein [Brevundimonas sp. TWP3-1-2b1]|uniref:hypothetical protein n=1 Tax=Brevundimonas sp. TWP3-1-2b1 TaxID=2804650 RepID=UPI003CF7C9AC
MSPSLRCGTSPGPIFDRPENDDGYPGLRFAAPEDDEWGRPEFTLAEVYGFEARLAAIYPDNNNVRPKIRQQLQVLRDMGWLAFNGRGTYRRAT